MSVKSLNLNNWLVLAAAGLLIMATAKTTEARGIRNNNPGNIKHSGAEWLGMSPVQTDPVFVQFESPEYGIRALAKLLLNYEQYHGLRTVGGIISRYAPGSENDTAAYIGFVANYLGVSAIDETISVQSRLPELIEAIITYENGYQPYSFATISTGIGKATA